jgi:hypothetical protein
MVEGALGISTGQGQGEAQIIKPFQSPVTAQQYGSVMAAQKKAEQDKRDKQAKSLASVADFQFKGLPQHAELFAKGYNDIIDYAVQNIDDPLIEFKLKQKMADLNTKANLSVDLKTNLQKQTDAVQQGEGKNYFLGFEDAVKDVVTPVDYNTFLDTGKWGQTMGDKANKINSVKTIPIYDVGKAKGDVLNQIGKWATINRQGRTAETPETVIDTFVKDELMGHPEALVHFGKVMEKDPVGAAAANNQVEQYAFDAIKKDLKAKWFTPEPKGSTFNIFAGGNNTTPNTASVYDGSVIFGSGDNSFSQTGQPTVSVGVKKTVTAPDPSSFDPTTMKPIKSGSVSSVDYGGMQVVDVLDEDVTLANGIVLLKGTPIPKGKSVAEIAELYFKNNMADAKKVFPLDSDGNVNLAAIKDTPQYKQWQRVTPKTSVGIFAVGTSGSGDKQTSIYTPIIKGIGALRSGLSKDDGIVLDQNFNIMYDEYIKRGGKPFALTGISSTQPTSGGNTGGTKTTTKTPKALQGVQGR